MSNKLQIGSVTQTVALVALGDKQGWDIYIYAWSASTTRYDNGTLHDYDRPSLSYVGMSLTIKDQCNKSLRWLT